MTNEDAARADLDRIRGLVTCDFMGQQGEICDTCKQAIRAHPVRVEVRSGWYDPHVPMWKGEYPMRPKAVEFRITMPGENVRIVGTLDAEGVPETAEMEYSAKPDVFPWHCLDLLPDDERADLLTYVRQMAFGG